MHVACDSECNFLLSAEFFRGAHDETWQQVQKQQVQKFKTEI
jgi:hypothetical protein